MSVVSAVFAGQKHGQMATIGDARQKPGIWTQHVDAASGRTFYFNLVQNRSFWELPPELLAQVGKPMIDTLREWDPEAAARYEQPASTDENEQLRKKRTELLQAAALASAAASEGTTPQSFAAASALQERMAIAAAQKRNEEMKRVAAEQKSKEAAEASASQVDNGYLSMVRELQAKDRDTDTTGAKWLVR